MKYKIEDKFEKEPKIRFSDLVAGDIFIADRDYLYVKIDSRQINSIFNAVCLDSGVLTCFMDNEDVVSKYDGTVKLCKQDFIHFKQFM